MDSHFWWQPSLRNLVDPTRNLAWVAKQIPQLEIDLIKFAGEEGFLFEGPEVQIATAGIAFNIDLPKGIASSDSLETAIKTMSLLETRAHKDTQTSAAIKSGILPLAMGALPFNSTSKTHLTVPKICIIKKNSSTWIIEIGSKEQNFNPVEKVLSKIKIHEIPRPSSGPEQISIYSKPDYERWIRQVETLVQHIKQGQLEKVVLARQVFIKTNSLIKKEPILQRLKDIFPTCSIFSIENFIGASPELLFSRLDKDLKLVPLAGTTRNSGNEKTNNELNKSLFSSSKQRHEHELVLKEIRQVLEPICEQLEIPSIPIIVSMQNVAHLASPIKAIIDKNKEYTNALLLLNKLHPTPAVAGFPREKALVAISSNEDFDRGRYAGPVGWVDTSGNGEWVIGIRSAEIEGTNARLLAGVGLVADSRAEQELLETQFKLQAILSAMIRP